jgi:hypothetical protein
MKGARTMPNFHPAMRNDSHNRIDKMRNDSHSKMDNALGSNLRRNQSSGAELNETSSSVKVIAKSLLMFTQSNLYVFSSYLKKNNNNTQDKTH